MRNGKTAVAAFHRSKAFQRWKIIYFIWEHQYNKNIELSGAKLRPS